jgi:Tol biopolymer transport system component
MIYEITESAERSGGSLFPADEIERLQAYLAAQSPPITMTVSELVPEPGISWRTLSLTEGALAWVEGDMYCVWDLTGCFGVTRLVVLDLSTGSSEVLLQMPKHAGGDLVYNVIVDGPIWSPNGQYVAALRGIRNIPVEGSLIIVDVSTGQVQEIVTTVDSGAPLVWAPDGATIAWELSRWHTRSSGSAVRLYTPRTGECRDIELDGLWVWNWSMDWAPTGEQIVFSAEHEESDVFSDEADIGLYLLDPSTNFVQRVSVDVDGALENPRWSPNGQLLAADYRPKVGDNFQSLLVIEPTSGQIVSQLSMQRDWSSWAWGRRGDSILVLVGADVGIFDVRDGSLRIVELPDDLATKEIGDLNW